MCTSSDTGLEWPGEGQYSSQIQINTGGQTGPLLIAPHLPFKINLSFNN